MWLCKRPESRLQPAKNLLSCLRVVGLPGIKGVAQSAAFIGEAIMAEKAAPKDWASDVKKYVPAADEAAIAGIVKHCGIALRTRDASLVSFTDEDEVATVRESFCKRKLGLTESDDALNAAIAEVGERMSDTNFRNRVTVYYLLAERYGKLALFGGGAATAAAVGAGAAAASATAADTQPAAIAPLAAMGAAASAAIPHGARPRPGGDNGDFFGLAALVFGGGATIMLVAAIAGMYLSSRSEGAVTAAAETAEMAVMTPAEPEMAAPEIPEGDGLVFELVDGKPKETVYFAVGSSNVAPDFAEVSAPIKAWMDANPTDRVNVTGFTDPTGDAAANERLGKARAEAVQAALVNLGIAADRIDMVKPADSSDADVALSEARRVEITVTGS